MIGSKRVRCARALRRMHMPTCVRVLGGGSFLDLALDEVAAAVARPPPVECDGGRGLAVRGRLVRSLAAVVRGEAQQFRAWCRVTRGAAEVRKQVGRPFRAPLPFPLLSPLALFISRTGSASRSDWRCSGGLRRRRQSWSRSRRRRPRPRRLCAGWRITQQKQ